MGIRMTMATGPIPMPGSRSPTRRSTPQHRRRPGRRRSPQAEAFRSGLASYRAELDALEAEIEATLAPVPRDRRIIVTAHDAFGYYARAYGVTFLAPVGISTETEPSAGAVARLIRQMKAENVRAVFVESIADPRMLDRIAAETGARIGGRVYSDALSGPDGPAPDYAAMMRHNTRAFASALGAGS